MPLKPRTRILIVDDDADWRLLLRLWLEDMGYEAVEASNGQEALAWTEKERFPVILLDMNMPDMSGAEVIEQLPDPATRVVLLTSSTAQDVNRTLSSGPFYYLPKDAGNDALSLILQSLH